LVGFAAHAAAYEATTLEEAAVKKLTSKNIDVVVANDVSNGAVFDAEDNSVLIVSNHEQLAVSGTKAAVASAVIDFIKPMLKSQ
ncbi:MAG: bifunctional 4'-phosphopantothenoylcysteine decarboxylase/phosphopantothenoylcysteine synthetase, partial [Microbacteriaceae bacterium]|nr:bifunctional 4'-phosphopantothenoylcysteine decarboxylase/phosphopantothenoylcysteine synthetase [Microbacteriaceae bacterium]